MRSLKPDFFWRPEVEGWSSDILPFYERMAEELPDGTRFAEVGVYKGRSLLWLAEQLVERGKTDSSIMAVDTWLASWCETLWEDFQRNYLATTREAQSIISINRAPSVMAATAVSDHYFDFVFIDGDHNYESVRSDIAAWLPKVKRGGIISGHDYEGQLYGEFPGVTRAVNEAFPGRAQRQGESTVWMVRL